MKSKIFSWRNAAALACATAAGAALWIASLGDSTAKATASIPLASHTMADSTPPQSQPTAKASDTPPDVPADEWNQVVAAMQAQPDGVKQLPRMGEYLTFRHRIAAWQDSKQRSEDAASRLQLGNYVLQNLPTHLGRGELTAFEARSLETEMLQDQISDPVALQQAVAAEDRLLLAAQPTNTEASSAEQASMANYKQREADITAQWMAMAPAQRDPKWLESQLDAARTAAFDNK